MYAEDDADCDDDCDDDDDIDLFGDKIKE